MVHLTYEELRCASVRASVRVTLRFVHEKFHESSTSVRSTNFIDFQFAYRFFWGGRDPGPVGGRWAHHKQIFGSAKNRQSLPRCLMVPLERVRCPELDLPETHYNALRSFRGSRWTIRHLWDVNFGKKSPPVRHHATSWGALTIFSAPKNPSLHGPQKRLGAWGLGD